MTAHKDDITMQRQVLISMARTLIRKKHSIAADYELNDVLPALESYFNSKVQSGRLPDVAEVLRLHGVLNDVE